jgi:hypothetical protein
MMHARRPLETVERDAGSQVAPDAAQFGHPDTRPEGPILGEEARVDVQGMGPNLAGVSGHRQIGLNTIVGGRHPGVTPALRGVSVSTGAGMIELRTRGVVDLQSADGRPLSPILRQPKRCQAIRFLRRSLGAGVIVERGREESAAVR